MKRRKTDCLFQLNANHTTKLPDLFFFQVLIAFSLICIHQQTFCQVLNPFIQGVNPFSIWNDPRIASPFRESMVWPPSIPIQSHQSWPQLNQVPPPFLRLSPVDVPTPQFQLPNRMPYPIEQSAPLYSSPAGLGPTEGVQGVDGSLGSGVHPLKDVTGFWNKLGLTHGQGTNFVSSLGTTSFIPGSPSQYQVQRILTPTTLTGAPFNPFLPPPGQLLSSDFQNRHEILSSLDPTINNRLGLLSMIDHRSNIEKNSLDSQLKYLNLQNQVLGLQMSPPNALYNGKSLFHYSLLLYPLKDYVLNY